MSNVAISCEDLSKQYRIGKRERYRALRDVLTDGLSAPFRAIRSSIRNPQSAIRNSSPQSAIRDSQSGILSRITEPTRGFAEINGRVLSLLEVGTGFHPELTGRENIYLNGAILGMKRAEIERRFDETVSCSLMTVQNGK